MIRYTFNKVSREKLAKIAVNAINALADKGTFDTFSLTIDVDCDESDIEVFNDAHRWRKVSEELPKDGSDVLVTDGNGIWLCYKTTMCDGSPWFQPNGQPHIEGVTHWMPLPKAP